MRESERVIEKGRARKSVRVSERAGDREGERNRRGGGLKREQSDAPSDRQEPLQTLQHKNNQNTDKHKPTCTQYNVLCSHSYMRLKDINKVVQHGPAQLVNDIQNRSVSQK